MTLSELSNFYYNADHQRILQDATKGTYWSAGDGSFERLWDRSDSRETYKYQLRVGDRSVGYLRQTYYTNGSNIDQRFYTLTDHLGSIQAVIGADGRKLQSLSFSAWGERRAADWNPSGIATPALDLVRNYGLTHGFTGHEADEPWGLINMKGRLYDPVVGRFLSADPFIQFTDNTQSYNRYTYVLNNPLSFTDPSGYHVLDDIFDFVTNNIRTIIAIGVGIVTGGVLLLAFMAEWVPWRVVRWVLSRPP